MKQDVANKEFVHNQEDDQVSLRLNVRNEKLVVRSAS